MCAEKKSPLLKPAPKKKILPTLIYIYNFDNKQFFALKELCLLTRPHFFFSVLLTFDFFFHMKTVLLGCGEASAAMTVEIAREERHFVR